MELLLAWPVTESPCNIILNNSLQHVGMMDDLITQFLCNDITECILILFSVIFYVNIACFSEQLQIINDYT